MAAEGAYTKRKRRTSFPFVDVHDYIHSQIANREAATFQGECLEVRTAVE
jgi:hypothetical protein